MKARDCGAYANRNPAAHEVRDDETPPPGEGPRRKARNSFTPAAGKSP